MLCKSRTVQMPPGTRVSRRFHSANVIPDTMYIRANHINQAPMCSEIHYHEMAWPDLSAYIVPITTNQASMCFEISIIMKCRHDVSDVCTSFQV